ncbi:MULTISPECIES: hypothetical protein [unclassified Bradyrhizobium]|nr:MULTISPECIES: hypothetical protein [unclassified Bradyrhizobium]WGS22077.1 hypothetical protein MTX22_10525 [Bradyrhizobium sp. ISRA463]WGS29036.1 hypothetical protein MTX19_08325 [Bradyrhizobium sp. ISRA464]
MTMISRDLMQSAQMRAIESDNGRRWQRLPLFLHLRTRRQQASEGG